MKPKQPSLFDDQEPAPEQPQEAPGLPRIDPELEALAHTLGKEWNEVPAELFLSWSVGLQLSYCMRRDEDSARREQDPALRVFYLERAASYKEELQTVKGQVFS